MTFCEGDVEGVLFSEAVMPKQRIGHIGLFSSFFEGLVGDETAETAETAEDGQKTVVNWPYLSTHIWVWGVCAKAHGKTSRKNPSGRPP